MSAACGPQWSRPPTVKRGAFSMLKHVLAAAMAAALIAAPVAPAFAQAATEKSDTKKKLTPQQQKMKDCAPKWAAYKKEKNVKGRAEHNKFMSTCLKG
jgi:Ni/Co efflux regulator RcnB